MNLAQLNLLAEQRYALVPVLTEEGEELSVDHHLEQAHHHAKHHLAASRAGDAAAAQHHATQANHHLMQARTKERAEQAHPPGQGMKMVFGVWRKVGAALSPDEHRRVGDAHAKLAKRQRTRVDARAMLAGTHPSEIPDDQKASAYADMHDHLNMAALHKGIVGGAHNYDPHGDPSQRSPEAKSGYDSAMKAVHKTGRIAPPSPHLRLGSTDPHAASGHSGRTVSGVRTKPGASHAAAK